MFVTKTERSAGSPTDHRLKQISNQVQMQTDRSCCRILVWSCFGTFLDLLLIPLRCFYCKTVLPPTRVVHHRFSRNLGFHIGPVDFVMSYWHMHKQMCFWCTGPLFNIVFPKRLLDASRVGGSQLHLDSSRVLLSRFWPTSRQVGANLLPNRCKYLFEIAERKS